MPTAPQPIETIKAKQLSPVLQALLRAKALSDMQEYKAKHEQIQKLVAEHPDDFVIDSMNKGIIGLTHKQTGFRIHIPQKRLPNVYKLEKQLNSVTDGISASTVA